MGSILHQRCFNHVSREAVARCLECTQFFCRECISEHDDRVICAACLKKEASVAAAPVRSYLWLWRLAQATAGLVTVWLFFYILGQVLLSIPSSFHEGTLWKNRWTQ
ncbi:MAG: rhomboid family protein [Verrucomicrobiales bacterium]|nr:rhomboid family protein [Verrucomicrobiales bacterium]